MKQERQSQDLKDSEILALYKKEMWLQCENYRGIKLLEIGLKVHEKVIDRRTTAERVVLHDNPFGFRSGRGTSLSSGASQSPRELFILFNADGQYEPSTSWTLL